MSRVVDDGLDASGFGDAAFVEDDDVFGDLECGCEVVSDVEDRDAEVSVHRTQGLEDGGSEGCIDHRDGFVGDDDFGFEHYGTGDHDALSSGRR